MGPVWEIVKTFYMLPYMFPNTMNKPFGKPSNKKFGENWDIVPTGRGGTLSLHISVPTEKITCSEWLRTCNKVIKYL